MKKSDIAGFIIYLLMFVIAIVIGLFVIRQVFEKSNPFGGPIAYLWTLLIILSALVFNAIMLEVLHLLGGKLGGYNVVMFNVLGLAIYKNVEKWKFGFKSFDGLTGETKLAPKSEKSKPHAYVWLPILGYLIELVAGIILFSIFKPAKTVDKASTILALFAIIYVTVSSMIAIYNFFPARLDSMTDGYRLTLITKPINVEAYNELMRIENLQREGKEVGEIRVFEQITEFTTAINTMSIYEKLGKRDFIEAEKMIDKIIEDPSKISNTTYNRLVAQKLYIKIMTLPLEEARKYYDEFVDDKIRRFISNDISMESIRAYVLIAGMLDESNAEVNYANSCKAKAMKRTLASRAKVEEGLYEEAMQMVKKAHPSWEIK